MSTIQDRPVPLLPTTEDRLLKWLKVNAAEHDRQGYEEWALMLRLAAGIVECHQGCEKHPHPTVDAPLPAEQSVVDEYIRPLRTA